MRTKQKANEVATAPSMVEAEQHPGDVWNFGRLSDILFYFIFSFVVEGREGGGKACRWNLWDKRCENLC